MNGETRMSTFGRKAAVAAVAFATVGSTLFGGAALAGGNGHNGYDDASNTGGPGGGGGDASTTCFLPIGISLGALLGQGGDVSQCNATGGEGGAGGPATADY
jgi:hypothetical protein